ncbi:T9SS type A sorting domain-containing protein [Pedobacter sp. BS3]|uniref:T9SS type A sorting domain-containing protein n=1 Tax=Pedobacter sp. BS3 TaxID=2567937 RepID=UPI0011EE3090|nr:T9SS type A sorting domain-containing protein [Pedobacter sp. BS3]TZF84858.1 T9SS type A sorting domain-containing protein [Pedobacter sp. BS3]
MKQVYLIRIICFVIAISAINITRATVRYVTPTGAGDKSGTSWDKASDDIQAMINASSSGDQIWLAAGTYLPTVIAYNGTTSRDKAFVLKSGVAIYGGFAGGETLLSARNYTTNVCILSGDLDGSTGTDDTYHVVIGASLNTSTILDGVTISGGRANGSSSAFISTGTFEFYKDRAAGIYLRSSKPQLSNIIIKDNISSGGGAGGYFYTSSPTVTNATIVNNTAGGNGGGLFFYGTSSVPTSPEFSNSAFSNNTAVSGGAIYISSNSSPTFTAVSFTGNTASTSYGGAIYNTSGLTIDGSTFDQNSSYSRGGAIYDSGSATTITNTLFSSNSTNTGSGGAVYISSNSPVLSNIKFYNNNTPLKGGAIFMYGTSNAQANTALTNCLFYNNQQTNADTDNGGGAIYASSNTNTTITNNTFYGNSAINDGGAINLGYSSSVINLYNTILYNNSATGSGADIHNSGSDNITVANSLTQAFGTDGTDGNIVGSDPLFASVTAPDADFLQLTSTSPVINKGDNSKISGTSLDLAGSARITHTIVDMGAYEYQGTLPVTLFNYSVKKQNNKALISWQTAAEDNNDYFLLERSTDGKTFNMFAKIYAKGAGQYSYTDNQPIYGINYYRLTQVDADGKSTDYGIRTLKFDLIASEINLYPNPSPDKVTIVLNGAVNKAELLDINGKILESKTVLAGQQALTFSMTSYPKGMYMVSLWGVSGRVNKKLIKL